jgi:hypothetical protein
LTDRIKLSRNRGIAIILGAAVLAAAAISPAVGGPSLKKLVKKEVKKQLAKKQGPAGQPGADFTASTSLRPGETLTGVWAISGGPGNAASVIQFAPQLPADLGAGAVHRLAPAATSTACPGQGVAAAGQLCVYERASGSATFNVISNPAVAGANNGANRRGAKISYITSDGAGFADGSWAVTAP